MAKPKGSPKHGGRTKGVPNKSTQRFRERLEGHGVDLEQELAKAIIGKDIEMLKALVSVLPYLSPRLRELEQAPAGDGGEGDDDAAAEADVADLLRVVDAGTNN